MQHVDTDLLELPQFLRFDEVELYYCYASNKLIEKKCHSVGYYLLLLKEQLKDLNLIAVTCAIKNAYVGNEIYQNDGRYFSSHSYLLDHFRNELLPLCGSSRGYKFNIHFHSEKIASTNVIASILQMDPIERCSTLEISLRDLNRSMKLPIESISSWLHRKCYGSSEKERFLRIYLDNYIQNSLEMGDYLKKVIYLYL